MNTSSFILAFAALLLALPTSAQAPPPSSPCGVVNVAKMSVMVMPRCNQGESPRKVWDDKENDRIAVAKVKEFFQGRGFQTVDFVTKLESAEQSKLLTLENVSDHKVELMRYSGAEIIVEVDMTWSEESGLYHATVVLKASEASAGLDMGTTTEPSNTNRLGDKSLHAMGAVENQADKFLDQMQRNFARLEEEGRPIIMNVTFASGSVWDMDTEVPTKDDTPLRKVLTDWVRNNAHNRSMQQPNGSSKSVEYPEIRIPLRNMETCDAYLTEDFGDKLRVFMKSIGVPVKQFAKGNKLMVTIQ